MKIIYSKFINVTIVTNVKVHNLVLKSTLTFLLQKSNSFEVEFNMNHVLN